jgi:hypothetical protein
MKTSLKVVLIAVVVLAILMREQIKTALGIGTTEDPGTPATPATGTGTAPSSTNTTTKPPSAGSTSTTGSGTAGTTGTTAPAAESPTTLTVKEQLRAAAPEALQTYDQWNYYYNRIRGSYGPVWDDVATKPRDYRYSLDEWWALVSPHGLSGIPYGAAAWRRR